MPSATARSTSQSSLYVILILPGSFSTSLNAAPVVEAVSSFPAEHEAQAKIGWCKSDGPKLCHETFRLKFDEDRRLTMQHKFKFAYCEASVHLSSKVLHQIMATFCQLCQAFVPGYVIASKAWLGSLPILWLSLQSCLWLQFGSFFEV
ncbi:hypothetical protein GOP47_0028316 [Adiantum capillus-veneris]|nr:hypothetical protein GOP47_0028316 [Adiantum capillus-veneris]